MTGWSSDKSILNNIPNSIDKEECIYLFMDWESMDREGNTVNVKSCKEKWNWERKDRWNICEEEGFAYRIEFNEDNLYVINMIYSSSGSGTFTRLILLEINGDEFTLIKVLSFGDRCQQGLASDEVTYKEKHIYYSEFITPYHLMDWNDRDLPYDAYDDCMVCCCGLANYKFDPISQKKDFLGIELILDESEGDDRFSKIYNQYLENDHRILSESDIIEFINKVENE